MLHARILNRNQLVTILIKWIFPKPVFKGLQHPWNFFELSERCFFLMRQDPILNIQHSTFPLVLFTEIYVVADIDVDAVVIDWIQNFPMKGFLLTAVVMIDFF